MTGDRRLHQPESARSTGQRFFLDNGQKDAVQVPIRLSVHLFPCSIPTVILNFPLPPKLRSQPHRAAGISPARVRKRSQTASGDIEGHHCERNRCRLWVRTAGRVVVETLLARGSTVRVAQRNRPENLPEGAAFVHRDILEPDAVRKAVEGAAQVLLAVSFPYNARVWRTARPKAMTNVIEACAEAGARIVFIDNLYQLGPQREPRREDMPLSSAGDKPAILAEVTRIWMAAKGRVRVAALRRPDFYVLGQLRHPAPHAAAWHPYRARHDGVKTLPSPAKPKRTKPSMT